MASDQIISALFDRWFRDLMAIVDRALANAERQPRRHARADQIRKSA